MSRFRDGTPEVMYDYPDERDTTNFIVTEFYPTGKVHKISTIGDLRIIGTGTVFYPDGKIYEVDSFLSPPAIYSDEWDGIVTFYYENGNPFEKAIIRRGVSNGLSIYYNMEGKIVKEYTLLDDSIKDGEYREYYANGRVSFKMQYKKGVPFGTAYCFTMEGDSAKYYAVNNKGQMKLPYKRWLPNGQIIEGKYLDSAGKVAIWRWFNVDGKEVKRIIRHSINKAFICPEPN